MLLRMYYLYKKAPKKLNQLREMHEIYKQTLDFEISDCNGTRWISHKLEAVKICLDKWSLYIEQNTWSTFLVIKVSQVKTQKLIRYHKKWKQGRMALMIAIFIDLLEIPSFLSLAFQKEKIENLSTIRAITKTKKHIALFEQKPFAKLPHVKHLLSKCNQIDGENYYQNVKLSNFKASFDSLSHKKNKFLDAVKSSIKDRLSEEIESNKIF